MVYNDEKEISLIDLCLYILKKWKLMVLAAAVLAVLAAGFTYMKSRSAYEAAMNILNTPAEEPVEIDMTAEEKEAFQLKLDAIEEYDNIIADYDYYLDNSIYVQLNANKYYNGTLQYIFEVDSNEELVKVVALCNRQVFSEENYEELAESLDTQTDAALLKEVVSAGKTSYEKELSTDVIEYVITVCHYDESECQKMLDFYEAKMELIAEETELNAEKLSGSLKTVRDSALMNVRSNTIKAKTDIYNAKTALITNMTDVEKEQYALIQESIVKEENEEPVVISVPEPGIDLKMVVLAAFAGVFCVAALYGCLYLFDGRVHGKKEMESWLNLPIIEAGKNDDTVAIMLSGIANQKEAKKVYVTSKGLDSADDQKLKAMLEKEGIAVVLGGDILADAKALQEVSKCDSVVLAEKCFVSKESEIKEKIEKATACGANVLAVVLEK